MINKKGRLQTNSTGTSTGPNIEHLINMIAAVPAAASVPNSSTSTCAWWITFEMNNRSSSSVMFPKSALSGSNGSVVPARFRASANYN